MFAMPAGKPTTKRRLPLLARHAISLGVVFVLALPLSYLGLRYYFQQQNLAQLDEPDAEAFNAGLAYVYANAPDNEDLIKPIIRRVNDLPDERAIELYRVMLRAYSDRGIEPPTQVYAMGLSLMGRVDMAEAVMVYRYTEANDEAPPLYPQFKRALDEHFTVEDPVRFLQLVEYYDSQGMWSRSKVPADAWLRWLVLLSHSPAETTQRQTARRLGELPDQADAPEIKEALTRLSHSEYPHVRAQVLKSIAGYAAIADDPTAYEQILFTLGSDENKVIARRAWLTVGHLNPYSGFSPDWQTADPYVAEAILWAAVKTNPDQIQPAMEAIIGKPYRLGAILAMDQRKPFLLLNFNNETSETIGYNALREFGWGESDWLSTWRSILTFDPHPGDSEYWYVCLADWVKIELFRDPFVDPPVSEEQYQAYLNAAPAIYLAATYRLNEYYGPREVPDDGKHLGSVSDDRFLGELAAVEGKILDRYGNNPRNPSQYPFVELIAMTAGLQESPIDSIISNLDLTNSTQITLLAVGLSALPVTKIESLLRLQDNQLLSALAIATGIVDTQPKLIRGVSADFLRKFPDITDDQLHAMTDAELAEHGLKRVDAIKALLEVAENNPDPAERYETTSLLKLALWMRGDLGDEFTPTAEGMLLDERLPTSTVLLALLHKQRPIALEYLFGDLVDPAPDLRKLFIQERFWHVFRRFVKTDDLDLWLWGDPAAQDFQLEAMRQWYWVNRFRISDFWISD